MSAPRPVGSRPGGEPPEAAQVRRNSRIIQSIVAGQFVLVGLSFTFWPWWSQLACSAALACSLLIEQRNRAVVRRMNASWAAHTRRMAELDRQFPDQRKGTR